MDVVNVKGYRLPTCLTPTRGRWQDHGVDIPRLPLPSSSVHSAHNAESRPFIPSNSHSLRHRGIQDRIKEAQARRLQLPSSQLSSVVFDSPIAEGKRFAGLLLVIWFHTHVEGEEVDRKKTTGG